MKHLQKDIQAIILIGGKGERMQAGEPKQFLKIHGSPLFLYSVKAFLSWKHTYGITIVSHPDYIEKTYNYLNSYFGDCLWKIVDKNKKSGKSENSADSKILSDENRFCIVGGGSSRHESTLNGILWPDNNTAQFAVPSHITAYFIHDGARPNISVQSLDDLRSAILNSDFTVATLAEKATETLVKADVKTMKLKETLNREEIFHIKTPQAVTPETLKKLLLIPDSSQITDLTTWAAEGGYDSLLVESGQSSNIKVTHPSDLKIAEILLEPLQ
jgi:2-C-methyl-D-erythritol 4-phosphate cytidylyltransferase